jgi:hypothetical protein
MKSKVGSEEPTGELDGTKQGRIRQGLKVCCGCGTTAVSLVTLFRLRSFYISPAKFTSHDGHEGVQ